MGFNDLFKRTIEIGKELKPTLPINYRKQFWNNFVQQVVEKGEVIKENNKFICRKNVNQTIEVGFSNIISVMPNENSNVKISFTDLTGKEFSFKTGNYSFDYNEKGFLFSKNNENNKIEEKLYITNSLKIIENMTTFDLNKIKFILCETETVIENLFYEFIVSPDSFENYVSNLWSKFSEPFSINFKENDKELNGKRIKLLIDSWDENENVVSETKVELEEEND